MPNFVKIRQVGAELFHADGRTDRHDEASSRVFEILLKRPRRKFLQQEGEEINVDGIR